MRLSWKTSPGMIRARHSSGQRKIAGMQRMWEALLRMQEKQTLAVGGFCKLGVLLVGVLLMRALLFWVLLLWPPDFWSSDSLQDSRHRRGAADSWVKTQVSSGECCPGPSILVPFRVSSGLLVRLFCIEHRKEYLV